MSSMTGLEFKLGYLNFDEFDPDSDEIEVLDRRNNARRRLKTVAKLINRTPGAY